MRSTPGEAGSIHELPEWSAIAGYVVDQIPGLYRELKIGICKLGIAGLSILIICVLYRSTLDSPTHLNPFYKFIAPLSLPALGTVFASDLDNPRFATLARSSTDKGDHGASIDHQDKLLTRREREDNWTVVKRTKVVESASTMDRESLNEYLQLAKDDRIDGIAFMEVDRLTRAPIFEAVDYYRKLEEEDCLLYVSSLGYLDLGNLNDLEQLVNQTFFARRWYLRIQEGASGAYVSELEKGKYPYGASPFGFETDEDHNIWVKEEARELMYRAFKIYQREENRSETRRRLNKLLRAQDKDELSDSQLKTLLESKLCIGQFTYDGLTLYNDPDLKVIDEESFRRVQHILRSRRQTKNHQDLPEFTQRAIGRYGFDYVYSILESFKCCRKCRKGELEPAGSDTVKGFTLQAYSCTNCEHQGPLLSSTEIDELHQTCSLRCPLCPATERFEVTKIEGFDEYRYTCQVCRNSFKHSSPPDKLLRGMEYSQERFHVEQSYAPPAQQSGSSSEGQNSENEESNEQVKLSNY